MDRNDESQLVCKIDHAPSHLLTFTSCSFYNMCEFIKGHDHRSVKEYSQRHRQLANSNQIQQVKGTMEILSEVIKHVTYDTRICTGLGMFYDLNDFLLNYIFILMSC